MKKRNRQKFGRTIITQKTKVIESGVDFVSNGQSPYWNWMERHAERNDDGTVIEQPIANPDVLSENEEYQERREYFQELLEDFSQTLSPREREVFVGLKNGFTEEEIADELHISRSSVKWYRANMKIKFDLCLTKQA